jgi:DNA-binding transcriptional regulator YdaS (Cro superfamily)
MPMDIKTYLETAGISQSELARAVGVRQPTVHKWVHGISLPDARHAHAIVRASGGLVTLEDIYGPVPSAPDVEDPSTTP